MLACFGSVPFCLSNRGYRETDEMMGVENSALMDLSCQSTKKWGGGASPRDTGGLKDSALRVPRWFLLKQGHGCVGGELVAASLLESA